LKVTAKGKKAVPKLVEAFEALNKNITEDISDEELKIFNIVLKKMENNIKSSTENNNETNLNNTP